jgi:uncharacterized protein YgiM (DUF1202 family)
MRIRFKLFAALLLVVAAIVAYYYYASSGSKPPSSTAVAFVLPDSLEVVDTPSEIRLAVESLKAGDRVEVLAQTGNWAKVKLVDGRIGWVESKNLLDSQTYEASQMLNKEIEGLPVQAEGHSPQPINLRFEPSREAAVLAPLPNNQKLEVFGRKVVEKPSRLDQPASTPIKEAWYLVRAGGRVGWVLGRSVSLDLPERLGGYVQGSNMVAWLVLNTVTDEGQQVPQYVAADRMGNQDVDFTHIRVFTWWAKNHHYVTAYAESGLQGYFPIHVERSGKVPYFRLNLVKDGNKIQKVYGLFDTITRPLGFVEGWESNALPASPPSAGVRRHR